MKLDHVVNHHGATLLVVDGRAIQLKLHELDGPVPGLGNWREAATGVLQPSLHLKRRFRLRLGHIVHGIATHKWIQ